MDHSASVDVVLHCPAGNVLGEGPLWVPEGEALVWVDIPRGRVMRLAASESEPRILQLPEPAGCVARLRGGEFLVAGGRSLYRVSFARRDHQKVLAVGLMDPSTIANDGAADPGGRFVFGSKHIEHSEPRAAAFSFGGGAGLREVHAPFTVFNGPAFSRGGDRIYFADTLEGLIFRATYDATAGRMGEPEVFVRVPAAAGYPDGMAVDSEDCLWNAHWDGSRLTRYSPDGIVERVVELPVTRPTALCFGGADLRTVFVTSAAPDDGVPEREGDGIFDGDIVRFRTDVPGVVEPLVRLPAGEH
ncbi:MAG: SMP-30/gluconolactonase/LRE family protein [Immundisolibacterales bacterium]|nr:SMP-30/gluconolactonase/LRE family protein [Immundisolibacterales bacterium]